MRISVVVIGARGHVGAELLPLLQQHLLCELVAVGSRSLSGQPVAGQVDGMERCTLDFQMIRRSSEIGADCG